MACGTPYVNAAAYGSPRLHSEITFPGENDVHSSSDRTHRNGDHHCRRCGRLEGPDEGSSQRTIVPHPAAACRTHRRSRFLPAQRALLVLRQRLQACLGSAYRIDREAGRGGMATVFEAEDLKHRRKVAIKVLNPELGAALNAERFLQEIRVTAGLHHSHILPLHDSGTCGDLLYYVLPFVDVAGVPGRHGPVR